jgi:hypothetical protein
MHTRNSKGLFCFSAGLCFAVAIVAGCAEGAVKYNISCPNGPQIDCACADGQTGTRQCLNDVYMDCSCEAAGSAAATTGGSTSAATTGAGGSVASSSAGAGGAYATKTRTGTAGRAGNTARTGQTAGSAGKATKETKITCPSPFKCVLNDALNGFIGIGGAAPGTVKFCAYEDENIFQMAGPTPPTCHNDDNCKAAGLDVECTEVNLNGLIYNGCFLVGCE